MCTNTCCALPVDLCTTRCTKNSIDLKRHIHAIIHNVFQVNTAAEFVTASRVVTLISTSTQVCVCAFNVSARPRFGTHCTHFNKPRCTEVFGVFVKERHVHRVPETHTLHQYTPHVYHRVEVDTSR